MLTKREIAQELTQRRAARRHLATYIGYTSPKYKSSAFSDSVCAALDLFIIDMQAGLRPILVLQAPPQHGKQMADDTPVLTTRGWSTHGELRVGDCVFSPSGKAVKILAVSEKTESNCKVELTNGEVFYCHENHLWAVKSRDKKAELVISTKDMLTVGNKTTRANPLVSGAIGLRGSRFNYQLPHVAPIEGVSVDLPVAPYTFGAWLGDGTRVAPQVSNDWRDIEIVNGIVADGYPLRSMWAHNETQVLTSSFAKLWGDLKKTGVTSKSKNWVPKRIPDAYLVAPLADRLQLLAGLIDTDGYVYQKNGRVVFTTAERELAESFAQLVATFGCRATTTVERPKLSSSGILGKKEYYVIGFNPDFHIPCRLERKRNLLLSKKRRVAIKSIEIGDWGRVGNCIQVDSDDGLYLVGHSLTPTHNSEIVSRKLPAYLMGRFPDWRVGAASYSDELAGAMAQDVRRNIASDDHKLLFPQPPVKRRYDINRTGEFTNPCGSGGYLGVGVGAGLTGRPVDIGIIDDPVKNEKEALSPTTKEGHWNWYQTVFTTRLSENSGQIIMATSWAEDDLPARICNHFRGDPRLTVLRFPAINEPGEAGFNPDLPRGALVPELKSLAFLQEVKGLFSDYWWSALYQQTPRALGGNVFKESGIRYYLPKDLPAKFDKVVGSLDATFKDTDGTDFVVFQVWGKFQANSYLLAQSRARMSFTKTISETVRIKREYPQIRQFYVEDKANGPAVIDTLKGIISGLIPIEPDGSKLARAHAVTHVWESGNVWLPHPDTAPWVKDLVGELTGFPAAANDDQVDAMTQALRQLYPLFNTMRVSQEALNNAMGIKR